MSNLQGATFDRSKAIFDDPFTRIPNTWVRGDTSGLSLVATGMLAYIMSHQHGYRFSIERVARVFGCGKHTVRKAVQELEDKGFLERSQAREGQRIIGMSWVLLIPELPSENRTVEKEAPSDPQPSDPQPSVSRTPKKTNVKEDQVEEESLLASLGAPSQPVATSPDPVIEELCNELADWIGKNTGKRPKIPEQWRTDCRRMITIDERTPQQIRGAIQWSQKDSFWCANILSMRKLREKYDTLALQASSRQSSGAGKVSTKDRVAGGAGLIAKFEAIQREQDQLQIGADL